MPQELPPNLVQPLADAIGDAFDMAELDGIVVRTTGARLYKEWVPEGDPHRVTAYKLLQALQEPGGFVVLFLAHVRAARPAITKLQELIAQACPEALTAKIELSQQVSSVLAGLAATRTSLTDPNVKQALQTSRDSLAVVVVDIETLEVYKNLHECLHLLQMKAFGSLRFLAKQPSKSAADIEILREYQEQLNTVYTKAREWADRFPAGTTLREVEIIWIDALETAANKYQPALDADNARETFLALNSVRSVLRREPFNLSQRIYATAKGLPLQNLTAALLNVSTAIGAAQTAIPVAYASMRDLHGTLLGRVREHKLCQDADNLIWDLEETFEHASDTAREDFNLTWPEARASILSLAALDPTAQWSKNTRQYSDRLDDVLERFGALDTTEPAAAELKKAFDDLKKAFDAFRREVRFHFFAVDAKLRADCAALVKIGVPLKNILEDLGP
jgi:hypothetical protein